MVNLLIVMGIVGFFILIVAWMIIGARQQQAYHAGLVQSLGFTPIEEPDPSLLVQITSVHPRFGTPNYKLKNVARRSFPYGALYLYDLLDTGGESTSTVENFAIAIVASGTDLPRFITYPRLEVGGKLAGWANQLIESLIESQGFIELDLEGYPDFEQKYFLFGEDEAAIKALFGAPLVGMLVREANINISANGDIISISRTDFKNRSKPDESAIRALVDLSIAIYNQLSG
jgi:hypothetical protein